MPHSILIVEDDLTFATMLKTWLGKKGFSVDTASSNARARKQLDAQPYDLVLSDLRLPDQDGIFLLSWMKEQKYNIPLIIMTGYADIQSAVQAIKHGASDYISKVLRLVSHQPFCGQRTAIEENVDIASSSDVFERMEARIKIAQTDVGKKLQAQADALRDLLEAYRAGAVLEDHRE